ncbi:MAG: FAD-binding oxidoreductase [Bacteroidia bacterium]|nr:FAD-binding oxidoreductase [Bacteroidia bacterium]
MNNSEKKYLIVGGGIAGLMLAYQLKKRQIQFLLVDKKSEFTSSKVAAGMFNPISGKRMTVNWKANELLSSLHASFNEMETWLGRQYLVKAPILQGFGNVKESNDFSTRLDQENFKQYVEADPQVETPLLKEFGYFQVNQTGWVKTAEWISDFQNYLSENGHLVQTEFSYENLKQVEGKWEYENKIYDKVIFCEGYKNQDNPYFNYLPFKLCKGQVLQIKCKGLNPGYILKKGVYLVHQYEDVYKVGATYEWDFEDETINEKGKESLIEKVKQIIELPFEIDNHFAGIRPTTRDRAAILGEHPSKNQLYIFNGLGTKGMLQAPFLSEHYLQHLEEGTPLFNEIDIDRFNSFLTNSQ